MARLPEGYCIDRTEVTRAEYAAWLQSGAPTPVNGQVVDCSWKTSFAPDPECMASRYVYQGPDADRHPAVCVDWCGAFAYCRGVGKRLCGRIGGGASRFEDHDDARVSQWYSACVSGSAGYDYPYGDAYQSLACNGAARDLDTTVPVASLPDCQSPLPGYEGVYDLSGNVWEWEDACRSVGNEIHCRVRGGSYQSNQDVLRCDTGGYWYAAAGPRIGLRCCFP